MKILHVEVKRCSECPAREDKESHGPCDSDEWGECKLMQNRQIPEGTIWSKTPEFPKWCPLTDAKKCPVPEESTEAKEECPNCNGGFVGDRCCRVCEGTNRLSTE